MKIGRFNGVSVEYTVFWKIDLPLTHLQKEMLKKKTAKQLKSFEMDMGE